MHIPPSYTITDEILHVSSKIDSLRLFISSYEITSTVRERIQRNSVLKSSLFSARIEGNNLHMDELMKTDEKDKKLEIFNILKAIQFIEKSVSSTKSITPEMIKRLHSFVVNGLRADGGVFILLSRYRNAGHELISFVYAQCFFFTM